MTMEEIKTIEAATAEIRKNFSKLNEDETNALKRLLEASKPTDLIEYDNTEDYEHVLKLLNSISGVRKVESTENLKIMRDYVNDLSISEETKRNMINDIDKAFSAFPDDDNAYEISGDMLVNDEVPLSDVVIDVYNTSGSTNKRGDITYRCRFVLMPDSIRNVNINMLLSGYKKSVTMMAVECKLVVKDLPTVKQYFRVNATSDRNGITMNLDARSSNISIPSASLNDISDEKTGAASLGDIIANSVQVALAVWLVLQYSLTNPVLKKYVSRVKTPNPFKKNRKSMINKCKIAYYKIERDVDINPEPGTSHEFKKTIWYVSGHWRQYKNGKRVFIHGYWKGSERDKGELSEPRDRMIVTE